jgi:hypothetical protein
VGQKVNKPIRLATQDDDSDFRPGRILLEFDAFIQGQKDFEPTALCE